MAGCTFQVKHSDVSHEAGYTQIIGKTYRTKQKLLLFGIKIDRNGNRTDNHFLTTTPGVGGPEVVLLGEIPARTVLKIIKVIREHPRPFGYQNIVYVAQLLEENHFNIKNVEISQAFKNYVKLQGKNTYHLNPNHFEEVN